MSRTKGIGAYFSFRKLITPGIVRIIHVIGLILINLSLMVGSIGGIIVAVTGTLAFELEGGILVVGIIVWIIATIITFVIVNLLWRIFCEQGILFFSIHEINASIEKHLIDLNKNMEKLVELNQEEDEEE